MGANRRTPAIGRTLPAMAKPHPKRQRRRLFIKQWREYRNKMTQETLGARVGVTQGMISQLETGTSDYTGELLEKIAYALRCEPADLLMRNPLDPEAPWSIWDTLPATERPRAVELLKALKRASGE